MPLFNSTLSIMALNKLVDSLNMLNLMNQFDSVVFLDKMTKGHKLLLFVVLSINLKLSAAGNCHPDTDLLLSPKTFNQPLIISFTGLFLLLFLCIACAFNNLLGCQSAGDTSPTTPCRWQALTCMFFNGGTRHLLAGTE